jgi:hypothetical protein
MEPMAENPKKRSYAKDEDSAPEASQSAPVSPVVSQQAAPVAVEAPEAPASLPPPEEQLSLQDAARRFVPGFKDHWWPGIRAHGKAIGFVGTGTVEQCKAVLRHWGAKI